jgi:diguanylate cyclase
VKQELLGQKGIDLASAAITAMAEQSITPTPENYAIWLCYLTKARSDLNNEIDGIIASGRSLDDRTCDTLYEIYFEDVTMGSRMIKAGGKIAAEMQDVVRDLKDVGQYTKAYGEQLQVAQNELSRSKDAGSTSSVVETLLGATNAIASKSSELHTRLLDSGREIEMLREQLEIVKVEASTDALTGVANRKAFESHHAEMAAQVDAGGGPLSLIMCDIDFFKRINDSFGHQTGDQVIRFVAATMDRAKPQDGLVARIGGEEFAMLLPRTNVKAAHDIAEKIRVAVESKRLVRRSTNIDLGQITVSLGVAQHLSHEIPSIVMERADEALYNSKRSGRNKVSIEKAPAMKAKAA